MESAGNIDHAAAARRVRATALAARPPRSPLPQAGSRPVDAAAYWLAAQDYFEAAARLYRGGDAARGDYCIVRGDAYVQLATLCVLANESGVDRGEAEDREEAGSDGPSADAYSREDAAELWARVAYLRKQHPIELPFVPLEAADKNPCLGFLDNAVEHAEAAEVAFASGDTVAGHYYSSEVDVDLLLLDICEQVIYGPTA